jgi:hypothetical protein
MQGFRFPPHFFNIILENPAHGIQQENEMKGMQLGKEKIKLCL